jgi:hypothetical protein
MSVFFIGAMPWVQLYDDGRLCAWATVYQVDWSPHGSGSVLALRYRGQQQMFGTDGDLAAWLADWLRHDTNGYDMLPFRSCDVTLSIEPATGLRASAGGISVEMTLPLDRQLIRRDNYPLGDFAPTASWVRIACQEAAITVDGQLLPGAPLLSQDQFGPSSTAQLNIAEVWTTMAP